MYVKIPHHASILQMDSDCKLQAKTLELCGLRFWIRLSSDFRLPGLGSKDPKTATDFCYCVMRPDAKLPLFGSGAGLP